MRAGAGNRRHTEHTGAGAQIDFTGVVLSLTSSATERARSKGRVFVMDQSQTVVCLQIWQFPDN